MSNIIVLNEYGMAMWRNKYRPSLTIIRQYDWCDSVIFLDESKGRMVLDVQKFSTFDFSGWQPITVDEYQEMLKMPR